MNLKDKVRDFIGFIINNFEIINFSLKDILQASRFSNLKIFDAMHYLLAKKADARLVTFDKDFKSLKDVIILE